VEGCENMKKKILIEGMSCSHCVRHVEEALKEIDGVNSVEVDLKGKNAVIDLAHEIENEKFKTAIEDVGYEVTGIETL
jgi:copper chaperone